MGGRSCFIPSGAFMDTLLDTTHETLETRHQTSLQSFMAPGSSSETPPALPQPLILIEQHIDKEQSVGCFQNTK